MIERVTITGPDRLVLTFKISQPRNGNGAATAEPAEATPVVRTMTTSVGPVGLEPTLART